MLKRLCAFFDCTPNDLFDWEGDDSLRLQELKKDPLLTFEVSLSGKSTKELEELHRKLRNGEL